MHVQIALKMARIDPGLFTIGHRCRNEEVAIEYSQELGLLPGPTAGQVQAFNQVLQQVQGRGRRPTNPPIGVCWKPDCNGNVIITTVDNNGPKLVYRCVECKGKVSAKVGSLDRYIQFLTGPLPRPRPLGTWFATIGRLGRPQSML